MDVSITEVFLAYRQGKRALFEEQRTPDRLYLAGQEARLPAKIYRLQAHLRKRLWFDRLNVGRLWVAPKGMQSRSTRESSVTVLDPEPSVADRFDIRLHLTPSLEFATVEMLWLWRFGPVLEAMLTSAASANRLKLRQGRSRLDLHDKDPFGFWPEAYRRFRDDGLEVAKHHLELKNRVMVATFDLAGYYDGIDPSFLLDAAFVESLALVGRKRGIPFRTEEYLLATRSLLRGFGRYREQRKSLLGVTSNLGLPIGSLSARVIANLTLSHLDDHVSGRTGVLYYGRYVDDILIVAKTDKRRQKALSVVERFLPVESQLPGGQVVLDARALRRGGSRFSLQMSKFKAHILEGQRGIDFIQTIEREVGIISSERRALINPDGFELESPLAALFVGAREKTPMQVLREVDRLKIGRYAASVAVGKVDAAVKLLGDTEGASWCRKQMRPLALAITDARHWVEFYDVAVRALGVAVRAADFKTSKEVMERLDARIEKVSRQRRPPMVFWNGTRVRRPLARKALLIWFETRIRQELCASIPARDATSTSLLRKQLANFVQSSDRLRRQAIAAMRLDALAMVAADLRTLDREGDWLAGRVRFRSRRGAEWTRLETAIQLDPLMKSRVQRIQGFVAASRRISDPIYRGASVLDVLLMTRPPSTFDIGYRWARAGRPVATLVKTINAVRGTRYPPGMASQPSAHTVSVSGDWLGGLSGSNRLEIVLGNVVVRESWAWAAAEGTPFVSSQRLRSIGKAVNQAVKLSREGRPAVLLLLPELAMPRQWLRYIAEHLATENVSLVTGVEYHHWRGKVTNEAVGVFAAGFGATVVCLWRKSRPARNEKRELLGRNLVFAERPDSVPLAVSTDAGTISTLICSELLEAAKRAALVGRVDLLLVPSWNPDTTTFDHTVQTTANDVHCYVAIANNAEYSDCRVQSPSDERYMRDVCRLICRDKDETLSVLLNFAALRRFQRASLANPKLDLKGFKPIPPEFDFKR